MEPRPDGGHRLQLSRQVNGRWGNPVTITAGEGLSSNWADTPSVVLAHDGTLLAQWREHRTDDLNATDVILGVSRDEGKTWRRLGTAHDDGVAAEHGFVSLASAEHRTWVAWLDGRQTLDGGSMTLRLGALGELPQRSVTLDSRVCDCCGTSTAVTVDGPIIVYRDRSLGELRDISIVRQVDAGWSEPALVHDDAWKVPGCPVNGPVVAARGRTVAVAWYTYAQSIPRVKVAFSTNAGASFGPPIEIDAPRDSSVPIGRVGLVLDEKDRAWVSWMTARREDGELLLRAAGADGVVSAVYVVSAMPSHRGTGFARTLLDGNRLLLAWADSRGIKLVRADLRRLSEKTAPVRPQVSAETEQRDPATIDLATLDGERTSLASLRGKPVLMNFWATWCEPCRMELPELAVLERRHSRHGLQVVGVSVDRDRTAAEVKAFARRRNVTFRLWHDPAEALAGALGVQALPASVLFDAAGNIVWRATGAVMADDEALGAALKKVLQQ